MQHFPIHIAAQFESLGCAVWATLFDLPVQISDCYGSNPRLAPDSRFSDSRLFRNYLLLNLVYPIYKYYPLTIFLALYP